VTWVRLKFLWTLQTSLIKSKTNDRGGYPNDRYCISFQLYLGRGDGLVSGRRRVETEDGKGESIWDRFSYTPGMCTMATRRWRVRSLSSLPSDIAPHAPAWAQDGVGDLPARVRRACCAQIKREYPTWPPVYITENGARVKDELGSEEAVHDERRVNYLREYFMQARQAMNEGLDLRGYFVWVAV